MGIDIIHIDMKIEFTIPLTKDLIVSEANRSGEHWTKKHKRHQTQKLLIQSYLNNRIEGPIKLPCCVILTRIAPRSLDQEDNLPMAFKSYKDHIADFIIPGKAAGRADDSKQLTWVFKQEKGLPKEYALKVQINSIGENHVEN